MDSNKDTKKISDTDLQRQALHRDRWSAFGTNTGILSISDKLSPEELKKYDIFQEYKNPFLQTISPDVSVAEWEKDSVLFEEGSYIDLAFFVVAGKIEVYLNQKSNDSDSNRPIFDFSRTLGFDPSDSISDSMTNYSGGDSVFQTQIKALEEPRSQVTYLSAMDFNLPDGEKIQLGPGEIFGEIGALNGWPQSVTAKTLSKCKLVQIRVPGLRQMRKRSRSFKAQIDKLYRERSLFVQLQQTPLLRQCDDVFIRSLADRVELISCSPNETLTIVDEATDALYLVRSGFLKLSQTLGEGQVVVSYLSKGMTLGEVELLIDDLSNWTVTATSVGYSELVKISRDDFLQIINTYPRMEKLLWKTAVTRIKETGYGKKHLKHSEFLEFSLETGLVEGNSILVIDLDTCTRCDDCTKACADTHGGRPRFVREGEKYGQFLITRACLHCRDPVCLIGCPTGAIRRANVGDVVEINENICIGCSHCEQQCPYDAITMQDTGDVWAETMFPEWLRGKPKKVATKCDLCYTSNSDPACVKNCPHGSAVRVGTMDEFKKLIAKSH